MHMIWINLIPQLVDLWTGKFHGIVAGKESYHITSALWTTIGNICEESGKTIPSSFGCRVPHLDKRSHFTAESWCLWATLLAPYVLQRRFLNSKYYTHFVRLIKLVKKCLSMRISQAELLEIQQGLATLYYQKDPDRLQVCTTNLHYLLHIVDLIEFLGPPSTYWSFIMEHYCNYVKTAVKSRHYPYANLTRRVRDVAQLRILQERYHLNDVIELTKLSAEEKEDLAADREVDYNNLLLTPSSTRLTLTNMLKNQIVKYLATAFKMPAATAKKILPTSFKQWGQMRIAPGGDLVHARGYHKLRSDGRDASFIRYELMVPRRRNTPEDLVRKSHYGQVQHVFRLRLPPKIPGNPGNKARTLLLALIFKAKTKVEATYEYEVVSYSGELSKGEIVDVATIQCVVGRVFDRKEWWIIDRTEEMYPEYV
ncbi:hypothetical protein FRC08_013841 [Ceratobasidium sp. 394]|nr:hypothetical protein FRC08_013841 [Ceratobasidium sp. 394]